MSLENQFNQLKQTGKATVKQTGKDLENFASDVKHATQETLDKASELSKEATSEIKDFAEDTAQEVQNKTSDGIEKVKDLTHEASEKLKSFTHDTGEQVKHLVEETAHRSKEFVQHASEKVKHYSQDSCTHLENFIREKPGLAVLGAIGIGCAVGVLTRALLNSPPPPPPRRRMLRAWDDVQDRLSHLLHPAYDKASAYADDAAKLARQGTDAVHDSRIASRLRRWLD